MTRALEPDLFRIAMGRFATGVTVLSTLWQGHDHAMTANALASVSMEPMLLLACVEIDARFHDALAESGVWGVSILSSAQRPAAASAPATPPSSNPSPAPTAASPSAAASSPAWATRPSAATPIS